MKESYTFFIFVIITTFMPKVNQITKMIQNYPTFLLFEVDFQALVISPFETIVMSNSREIVRDSHNLM